MNPLKRMDSKVVGNQRGNNMPTVKYDKIIRDNIPDIIHKAGKECTIKNVSENEKTRYLLKKAHEEIDELSESKKSEEMADVLEVLDAIIDSLHLDRDEIEKIKVTKKEKNGGFEKGIVLLEVMDK